MRGTVHRHAVNTPPTMSQRPASWYIDHRLRQHMATKDDDNTDAAEWSGEGTSTTNGASMVNGKSSPNGSSGAKVGMLDHYKYVGGDLG